MLKIEKEIINVLNEIFEYGGIVNFYYFPLLKNKLNIFENVDKSDQINKEELSIHSNRKIYDENYLLSNGIDYKKG